MTADVHIIVPGDIDDPKDPSGGNAYDRRVSHGLAELGWTVDEIAVKGTWPYPELADGVAFGRALAAVPDGELVLLDGLVACAVPEIVVPQSRRLRMVVLVHLPLADETGLSPAQSAELDLREHQTLHAVSAIVATSPWAARRLAEHHGLPSDSIHIVTPGVDPAPLAPGTDGVSRLVCVASVTPRKGQDVLVQALAEVADLPWNCEIVGPFRRDRVFVARLLQLIVRHDLGERLRLAGPRLGLPLEKTYANADLVVLPTRAETYGMVVTEALARGIPVLASAVDGVPETLGIDHEGIVPGMLVPPGDVDALATALRHWFGEPDVRRRLRRSASDRRGMLEEWKATSQRMAGVLERVRDPRPTIPGSPRFAADWLALREPADTAARSEDLLEPLRAHLARKSKVVIRDLGCGTGSQGRWLAPRLTGKQRWVLHDRDPELLGRAVASLVAHGVTVETREGDITELRAADLEGTSLVTASALLDLLTFDEVDALATACAEAGVPALFTLSVVGQVSFSPSDSLDAEFAAAFNAHQRRRDGGRRLLGPDAVAAATETFSRRGAVVRTAPSPWRLGPGDPALIREWLRGWVDAASAQRPDLVPHVDGFLRRHLDANAAGGLRVVVQHSDLLAIPAGMES